MIMESKKMFVDDFDGETIVNSEYELIKILKKRPAFDWKAMVHTPELAPENLQYLEMLQTIFGSGYGPSPVQ
jgi:hypothetical protein